jgi:dolichyl-phosphate beta-glucosyltransferase
MVPARLALFTALFAGLLLAVALEELWAGGWRRRALAVATGVLALAFLVPSAPLQSAPVVATPAFFTTSAVTTLPRDGVALVVPFPRKGRDNEAMLWQARAGMWFKMPGGYFVGPGPGGDGTLREAPPTTTSRALDRIRRGERPPDLTPALRRRIAADLEHWRVGSVVLGPMPHRRAMAGFLSDLLGRPPERLAGVGLWRDATVAPARRA